MIEKKIRQNENIIVADNVSFRYPNEEGVSELVLQGLNLKIAEGSFVAVLGHNGSGKSTFAKLMNAILLPEGGTMLVAGIDTHDEERVLDIRRQVGMVFQNPDNQMVANVVEEDVAFGPENMGVEPAEIRSRVDNSLKLVDMSEYALHAPHLLSGGQKQRVAIAGVIAMRPRCIVLDEPTAMLDPAGRAEVINTVKDLNKSYGITIVLITHHMDETIDADRLVVMSDGLIVEDGKPSEVFCRVEEMRGYGLDVPDTTGLLYALNKDGFNLPLEALSVEQCSEVIFDAVARG
jgi:energy-coupling factor transport system ATP-binding protein